MQMFLQYTNQWDNLATEVHVVYSLHGCIKCEKCVSYKKNMLLITFEGGWKWEVRKKLMLWKYIFWKNNSKIKKIKGHSQNIVVFFIKFNLLFLADLISFGWYSMCNVIYISRSQQ